MNDGSNTSKGILTLYMFEIKKLIVRLCTVHTPYKNVLGPKENILIYCSINSRIYSYIWYNTLR